MAETLELKISNTFKGIIYNTLADGNSSRLFLEIRDLEEKKVTFSALNLQKNQWLWKDICFEDSWWVSLGAVAGDMLLLTVYTDTSNPDKKSLIAFEVQNKQIIWWYNGFALSSANTSYVKGVDLKMPFKEILLDLFTGKPVQENDFDLEALQNFPVIRPFQYEAGTEHFVTTGDFLRTRLGITPVITIEYLEFKSLIIASVFVKDKNLANYLYVFASGGELLMQEILGEDLKGVGLDTFFIFSDHLIFVKNKRELVSYKIV